MEERALLWRRVPHLHPHLYLLLHLLHILAHNAAPDPRGPPFATLPSFDRCVAQPRPEHLIRVTLRLRVRLRARLRLRASL